MEAITQAIQRIGLPWEQTGETRVSVLAEPAPPAPRLAEERRNDSATNSVAIENGSDAGRSRARRERLPALFSDGRLRAGQTLRIRDRIDSEAIIIDSQKVKYKGKILSWNEWGQIVTGWPSINIYLHAETSDGILIDQLRRPL
jgi:hypothetical protein